MWRGERFCGSFSFLLFFCARTLIRRWLCVGISVRAIYFLPLFTLYYYYYGRAHRSQAGYSVSPAQLAPQFLRVRARASCPAFARAACCVRESRIYGACFCFAGALCFAARRNEDGNRQIGSAQKP